MDLDVVLIIGAYMIAIGFITCAEEAISLSFILYQRRIERTPLSWEAQVKSLCIFGAGLATLALGLLWVCLA